MPSNRTQIALILLLGFALRIFWLIFADTQPVSQFESFRSLGEGIIEYGPFGYPEPTAFRFPGYPAFLGVMMLVSESTTWLGFTSVVLSTSLIYVVFRLTLALTGTHTASLIAALITAVAPTFVYFAPVLASEHLFTLLLFTSFLTAAGTSSGVLRKSILAGVLIGLATLTRGSGLFYAPLLAAVILFTDEAPVRRRLVAVIALTAVVIAVLSPWYLRNYSVFGPGAGLSTTGGINFYCAHNPDEYGCQTIIGTPLEGLSDIEAQENGYRLGLEYLQEISVAEALATVAEGTRRLYLKPAKYSLKWSLRLPREHREAPWTENRIPARGFFDSLLFYYYLVIAFAFCSLLLLRKYAMKAWIMLYGVILMNWAGYALIFYSKPRYRYTAEVTFMVLAAIVIFEISLHMRRHLADRRAAT